MDRALMKAIEHVEEKVDSDTSSASHTHAISDITNLQTKLDTIESTVITHNDVEENAGTYKIIKTNGGLSNSATTLTTDDSGNAILTWNSSSKNATISIKTSDGEVKSYNFNMTSLDEDHPEELTFKEEYVLYINKEVHNYSLEINIVTTGTLLIAESYTITDVNNTISNDKKDKIPTLNCVFDLIYPIGAIFITETAGNIPTFMNKATWTKVSDYSGIGIAYKRTA